MITRKQGSLMRPIENAISFYLPEYECDCRDIPQESFIDLLADCLLLAKENGLSPQELARMAMSHYLNEVEDSPGISDCPDDEKELEAREEAYRQAAIYEYKCDEIEIDADAKVSESEEGAWVQAWVWVSNEGGSDD